MKTYHLIFSTLILALIFLEGCVSQKKYFDSLAALHDLQSDSLVLANKISDLETNNIQLHKQVNSLTNQNSQLTRELDSGRNRLSQTQISLQEQQRKLEHLQALLDQQRSKASELKEKMSNALIGFSANELTVTEKNGKVYVSLSENLLFPSGSAVVNTKGKDALSKLAAVLIVYPDISVNIEGHTDTVPIHGKYRDNWELSVARSTAIVRILVNNYKVDPERVEASGHSQYDPVDDNGTEEGRAKNRRTEIILSPKLDELFKLLET